MENPFKKRTIERLQEGDYQQFLIELAAFQLVLKTKTHPKMIAQTLDLLNKSYDLFGEGMITADKGVEVIEIPKELQPPDPRKRNTYKVFEIDRQFTHIGHGLGFQFNSETSEFVLSFTDTDNPFDLPQELEVAGAEEPSVMQIPQPKRTIHVPVFVPHSITMNNGYQIESQLAA